MKSHAMKHCTIIYDGPPLAGTFAPLASGEAAFVSEIHVLDNIKDSVEYAAERQGYDPVTLIWRDVAQRPLRVALVCPDELADQLRMDLIKNYIVELNELDPR